MDDILQKLGSEDIKVKTEAGLSTIAYLQQNEAELEYTVTRLIAGLQSQNPTKRTGCYGTLALLFRFGKLKGREYKGLLDKNLQTTGQNTKKERRLIYIARILGLGLILRIVPLQTLLQDGGELLSSVFAEIVEAAQKRTPLYPMAHPFLTHFLYKSGIKKEAFTEHVLPKIQPLFEIIKRVKKEDDEEEDLENMGKLGEKNSLIAELAIICGKQGLMDESTFLNDAKQLVRMMLSHPYPSRDKARSVENVLRHVQSKATTEEFWSSLHDQMRSSHFNTVCLCIQKSMEVGISPSIIAKEKLVTPILGVFKMDASEETAVLQKTAVETLNSLLKWKGDSLTKKEKKTVLKALFGNSPNVLHEYQKFVRVINTFLQNCNEKDIAILESLTRKHLESLPTPRMAIVYLQFLGKLAKVSKKEEKVNIAKFLLRLGFGLETISLKEKEEDNADSESLKEKAEQIKKACRDTVKSILSSSYNFQLLDEFVTLVGSEADALFSSKHKELKKLWKKVEKQWNKEKDQQLKYLLGAYGINLVFEQDQVLGEAKTIVESLLEIAASKDEDKTSEIVQFLLSTVSKDVQPPLDYEALFSKLVVEGRVKEEVVQQFVDVIDVEDIADEEDDEDDDEESDESEDDEDDAEADKMDIDDEEKLEKGKKPAKPIKSSKKASKNEEESDSDASEESIALDEASAEDLEAMDLALARVFATKKKMKEEESSSSRSLMRTFRLLSTLLLRSSKACDVSLPLMLLVPVIHRLQHSLSVKSKSSTNTSKPIVNVLNKLNSIRKFEGLHQVEKGIFLTMAKDLVSLGTEKKNKLIADLISDSVVMLTRCYLQQEPSRHTPGEDVGFQTLYTSLLDLREDNRKKTMHFKSNLLSSALTTLPNFEEGKEAICTRIADIVFIQEGVRPFRKIQLLMLLRAALKEVSPAEWKVKAIKVLMEKAEKLLKSGDIQPDLEKVVSEFFSTLSDTMDVPEVFEGAGIAKFMKKLWKNKALSQKLSERCNNKDFVGLKKLLQKLDLLPQSNTSVVKSPITNGTSVPKPAGGGKKRKSEPAKKNHQEPVVNEEPETPSRKKAKSKQGRKSVAF